MDLQHLFSPSGLPRGKWTLVKIEYCDDSHRALLYKDSASLVPDMEIWNSNSAWYSSPGIKIVEVGEGFVTFTHPMIRREITLHPGERMRTNEYQVAPYEYGYTHIEMLAGRYSRDKISKRPWKESFEVSELDTDAAPEERVAPPDDEKLATGVIHYDKNSYYEGEIIGELRHGKGIQYWDGNSMEGTWVYNRLWGPAIKRYPNGDWEELSFVDHKCEGKAVYHFANGDYYESEWHGDVESEHGTYHTKEGEVIAGEVKDFKRLNKERRSADV